MNLTDPIFFASNRVWRCYTGGKLLDEFVGQDPPGDGNHPEEWLASHVRAQNGERGSVDEGIAHVADTEGRPGPLFSTVLEQHAEAILGPAHVETYGQNLGVLCKYLDSAVRLPIQCHPSRTQARELYGSAFGKAEAWYILDTRSIGEREPYLLMGFREGVRREEFHEAVSTQNISAMEEMLHRLPARVGQTYIVPPGMPHAIGPGIFMLEVQEPSDWVVQPEKVCDETELTERDMWGPLSPEQGMDVFDFTGYEESELKRRVRCAEHVLLRSDEGYQAELIGSDRCEAFGLMQVEVVGRMHVTLPRDFAVVVCIGGEGRMQWAGGTREIRAGEYFLQPYGVPWVEYLAYGRLSLLFGLPPAVQD